jgi:hypothetical protein
VVGQGWTGVLLETGDESSGKPGQEERHQIRDLEIRNKEIEKAFGR